MTDSVEVLVIGAGVSGLTTAVCLAESGLRVRIRTAAEPRHTTSAVPIALVGPAFSPPDQPDGRWERESIEVFTGLAAEPATGVRLTKGLLVARPGTPEPPAGAVMPDLCPPEELPAGFAYGFSVLLPVVDMRAYLGYLVGRFTAAGGAIEMAPVDSLAEAAEQAPLVVNCSGLGAAKLAGDATVKPIRGQLVMVANPGLDTFFMEAPLRSPWVGYFPFGDLVALGNVSVEDDWNTEPDPAVAEEIVRLCAEVEPRLADATVIEHRVGLRPGRPTVRVATEQVGSASRQARCVHNYGHGGRGVMLSWGCAREAAAQLIA